MFGVGDTLSVPQDPLVDVVLEPMRELLGRYRALSARLESAARAIEEELVRSDLSREEGRASRTEHAGEARIASLETRTSDVDTLLEFQERLSEIPGVLKVTVAGAREGRSTFLIELAEEAGLVVCANCGKQLVAGRPPASHGLCDDCRANYGAIQG